MVELVIVFLNILLIELVLSIDNASVLAVVVNKQLDNPSDRKKALQYGIIGAYVFRGLSLLFVSYILYNPSIGAWFKILGGLYLCYLFYTHLTPGSDSVEEGSMSSLESFCKKLGLSKLWTTILMVEFLDIVFSIDNLLAVVSLSKNLWVVVSAVFLGILGMRFISQYFSNLLIKYPSLEHSAFYVILLLGIKIFLAGVFDFFPTTEFHKILNDHNTDLIFSLLTLLVFIVPILKTKFTNVNN